MAHYYYVVYFDEETKEWKHDYETESIKFDDGTIWNTETEEWESGYREDGTWNDTQEEVDLILFDGLKYLDRLSFIWRNNNGN
jgi:hypothetical protein